jgi:hypothetical protein
MKREEEAERQRLLADTQSENSIVANGVSF